MSGLSMALTQTLSAGLLLFAAGLFAGAALHKVRTFVEFTGFVRGYGLLPDAVVGVMSGVVVIAEIAAILGALQVLPALALLPTLLLLGYAAAMAVNLLRGRNDIDCGCGGTPMPISAAAVARNVVLALAFGWAATQSGNALPAIRSDAALAATVVGFALCLGLLYAVFNQLEANRAVRRRLWQRPA